MLRCAGKILIIYLCVDDFQTVRILMRYFGIVLLQVIRGDVADLHVNCKFVLICAYQV